MSSSPSITSGASKSVPRIVPWLDAEDWKSTRKLLYSAKLEDIRQGILQVKIWMERGKVPTAVESTVNFLEIILIDKEYLNEFLNLRIHMKDAEEGNDDDDEDDDSKDNTEMDVLDESFDFKSSNSLEDRVLRLAYNTSIIRFVNELVDRSQKSLFATSITKLADQIGLPRVFVDIRHDGTHDKLNSLELLRWAALEALKWLENDYWSFEDDSSPDTIVSDFVSNVHELLDQYCDQLEKINDSPSLISLEKSSYSRIISQIDFLQTLPRIMKLFLNSICDYKRKCKDNVIESLLRPLARNNGDLFYESLVEILLNRKESDDWIPWIFEELKRSNEKLIDTFSLKLLEAFAKQSSAKLFQEKLVKIWGNLLPIVKDEKIKNIFNVFESIYAKKITKTNSNFKISESKNLVNKRKYTEDESIEGWSVVGENWRPCPLGSIPM